MDLLNGNAANLMEKIQFDGVKVKISTKRNMKKIDPKILEELRHISDTLDSGKYLKSPITLDKGIDAMLVIRAAHKSHKNKTNIII